MSTEPNTHEPWLDLASLHALGALAGEELAAFETHLATCLICRRELASLRPVADALAAAVPQVDPPEALRARVLAAVGVAAPVAGTAPAVASREAGTGGVERGIRASATAWLGLAASVMLAAGLGTYAVTLRGRIAILESELRVARAQASEQFANAAATSRAMAVVQERVDVLSAPDASRVTLAGQAVAPNAAGQANWSPTRGLALAVDRLPSLRPDRTYQVWLLTSGAPVSVGLLQPDAGGDGVAVFAPPPGGVVPTGIALSEEPTGGVPAPTGQIYLVGLLAQRGN